MTERGDRGADGATTLVVGGGILGLTLALRLAQLGARVDVVERERWLGGLASAVDYGEFRFDRFYHCVLPSDARLLALFDELGLSGELHWRATRTGWYGGGRVHEMTGGRDFLRFPLLSLGQKVRLGAALAYATRFADPLALHDVTAVEWLTRLCGRATFETFWRPLLRAKFGTWHDRVAAVFLWATLRRLWRKPGPGRPRGTLGHVRGGYAVVVERLAQRLRERHVRVESGATLERVALVRDGRGDAACEVRLRVGDRVSESRRYDQLFFTAPARALAPIADEATRALAAAYEQERPAAQNHLGVICVVLVLKRPLTPFYVLNLGDPAVDLTGVVETTNLVDAATNTAGRALVFLPRYLDSADPAFDEPDDVVLRRTFERGVAPLFPDLRDDDVVGRFVHRARFVQPLPVVGAPPRASGVPRLARPLQIVNSALLECATLNNDEIVGLVDDFVAANRGELSALAAR